MDLSGRATSHSGTERRIYPVRLEVRKSSGGNPNMVRLEGYASVVDTPYEMYDMFGPYTEVVDAGAFTRTLSASPQVQLLLNHGGLSMAYTQAGTLQLSEDSTGLHIGADVNTSRSDVSDMVTALDDGNIDEMSFAFRTTRQQWSPDYTQRNIKEVDIHRGDVSVVNFGASPTTSVATMRAQDFDRIDLGDARALVERLQRRLAATDPAPAGGMPLGLAVALAQSQG